MPDEGALKLAKTLIRRAPRATFSRKREKE
jgi:hypothetical protein